MLAQLEVHALHLCIGLALDTLRIVPDRAVHLRRAVLSLNECIVARLVVGRERIIFGLVEQGRLLVDHEVVNFIDDQDGAGQVKVTREEMLIEEGVVLLLEAVTDVGGTVDRLVACEPKRLVEALVVGKVPFEQPLVVLEDVHLLLELLDRVHSHHRDHDRLTLTRLHLQNRRAHAILARPPLLLLIKL